MNALHPRLKVLLITEGTYPYRFGGVSTWCHQPLTGLRDVEYQVLGIVGDPDVRPIYVLPANVWPRQPAVDSSPTSRLTT
jgi:hypothetical protein